MLLQSRQIFQMYPMIKSSICTVGRTGDDGKVNDSASAILKISIRAAVIRCIQITAEMINLIMQTCQLHFGLLSRTFSLCCTKYETCGSIFLGLGFYYSSSKWRIVIWAHSGRQLTFCSCILGFLGWCRLPLTLYQTSRWWK